MRYVVGRPVVIGSVSCMVSNFFLAFLRHCSIVQVVLEASNDARMAMLNVLAELLNCAATLLFHWELEINVLSHVDFLVEQRRSALIRQILPPAESTAYLELLC